MKNINIKYLLSFLVMTVMVLGVFSSCNNDDSTASSSAPVITSVAKSVEGDLVPVTIGDPKNYYIIQGTGLSGVTKIYFNDFDTYFNPAFVTDTAIFVLIDENTPYANSSNTLKVVTKMGTVVYNFVIAPPTPSIKSFNPINAVEGDIITIYGNYFLDPVVKIGNETLTVVSSTLTEIKVKVPAGADRKYITVANISGETTTTDAIGTAIYDDAFYGIDGLTGSWGTSNLLIDNSSSDEVAQGTKAIKLDITAWSGFQIDMWNNGGHAVPTGATGIKFQMKLKAAAKVRVIYNGDWGHEVWLDITPNYSTYFIKWSEFGLSAAPAIVGQLVFGSDGTATTFYLDNIGFKL